MNNQLFIPKKIKVGFQNRKDTYTGKLAYVIYYDSKGVLRKEVSWKSWCNENIPSLEVDNTPTDGFVFNKDVGGVKQSYGWDARIEKVRVYDPRDFEIEISIPNMLTILRDCDCYKGKGIDGKFVYSWNGTELVLLPVCSEEYQNSQKFTKLQGQNVLAKDLIPGATYLTNKQEHLVFVGRFPYHHIVISESKLHYSEDTNKLNKNILRESKRYVFYDNKDFVYKSDLKTISELSSDKIVDNFPFVIEEYNKEKNSSKIVSLEVDKTIKDKEYSDFFDCGDGVFERYEKHNNNHYYWNHEKHNNNHYYWNHEKDDIVYKAKNDYYIFKNGKLSKIDGYNYPKKLNIRESDLGALVVTMENGNKFKMYPFGWLKKI